MRLRQAVHEGHAVGNSNSDEGGSSLIRPATAVPQWGKGPSFATARRAGTSEPGFGGDGSLTRRQIGRPTSQTARRFSGIRVDLRPVAGVLQIALGGCADSEQANEESAESGLPLQRAGEIGDGVS